MIFDFAPEIFISRLDRVRVSLPVPNVKVTGTKGYVTQPSKKDIFIRGNTTSIQDFVQNSGEYHGVIRFTNLQGYGVSATADILSIDIVLR